MATEDDNPFARPSGGLNNRTSEQEDKTRSSVLRALDRQMERAQKEAEKLGYLPPHLETKIERLAQRKAVVEVEATPPEQASPRPPPISATDGVTNFHNGESSFFQEPMTPLDSGAINDDGTEIPTPPASGTHVLASVNGELQWLATEDC
jgi:hypothetical protein